MNTIALLRIVFTLVAVEAFVLCLYAVSRNRSKATESEQKKSSADDGLGFNDDSTTESPDDYDVTHRLYENETLDFSTSEDCVGDFKSKFQDYCDRALVPGIRYRKSYKFSHQSQRNLSLCPCISPFLKRTVYLEWMRNKDERPNDHHPELSHGGHWTPTWCIPRQRIAIIVPYRDRQEHLSAFIKVIHPFLQNQLHYYSVFVIEQKDPWIFNKASLMNVGFKEASAVDRFDCFIFHDVDMIPEDDLNYYGCYKEPRHVGVYLNLHHYVMLYSTLFGGATGFTRQQFEAINGYSNEFYGWGGEDDDIRNRVAYANMSIMRYPNCVARYTMFKHKHDKGNPFRYNSIAFEGDKVRPEVYKINGLNSLRYKVIKREENLLYTWILVSLPDPPPPIPPNTTISTIKTTTKKTTTTPMPPKHMGRAKAKDPIKTKPKKVK